MIDVKKTFKQILRQWGHDVFLQRVLANGNHADTFQRVTTRQLGQSGAINANSVSELEAGLFTKYDAVYYFEENVNPREDEWYFETFYELDGDIKVTRIQQ